MWISNHRSAGSGISSFSGLVRPGNSQLSDIGTIDLIQAGVAGSIGVASVITPLRRSVGRRSAPPACRDEARGAGPYEDGCYPQSFHRSIVLRALHVYLAG